MAEVKTERVGWHYKESRDLTGFVDGTVLAIDHPAYREQTVLGPAVRADLAADALRELSIRGIDGTKATAAGFTALGLDADVMAQKLAAGGPSAQKATSEIIQALSGMSDPIAQEAAGVALFGTRYEELGPKAIAALDPATAGLTDYEGAAKKAGDTLNDNTASSVEGFKRKASEMASNLAAKAIPHLEKLGRGFAGLPGPAQAAIAGLGGLAVAAGPISNTVDGVKMVFQNTPGTEAPAEMNTYFRKFRALWAAENITGTIHNIYTPRGAPVLRSKLMRQTLRKPYAKISGAAPIFPTSRW